MDIFDGNLKEHSRVTSDRCPPEILNDLLNQTCRALLRELRKAGLSSQARTIPTEESLPTRAAEAMYPLALLYAKTGEQELLEASRNLGTLLAVRQKGAGYWVESEKSQWHGCTIFKLLAMAATYILLRDSFDPEEDHRWRTTIRRAADWISAYQPVSHIEQTLVTVGEKIPLVNRMSGRSVRKRFLNVNYIATIPAALHYAWQALDERKYLEKIPYFIDIIVRKSTGDGLISGENMEVGPKFFKFARRTNSVDIGYNLDMTLGMLAIYADMAKDHMLLEWVRAHADAHLAFFYPDGSIDNGIGLRGYKSIYFGSETAHGIQMLLSVLSRFDAKYERALELNANLIAASIDDGLVQRGPFQKPSSKISKSLYQTFTRSANFALAIAHYPKNHPLENTKLPCEEADHIVRFGSINTIVVKKSSFMATVTGAQIHSSCLPFRFMTPPTGGSLSALYHQDYGPIQLSSPYKYIPIEPQSMPPQAEKEPITARIELVGTGYTNQHDTGVDFSIDRGIVEAKGYLRRRLTLMRRNSYQIAYAFSGDDLKKTITINGLQKADQIRLVEPIVLSDGVISTKLDKNTIKVTTKYSIVTMEVDTFSSGNEIKIGSIYDCYSPPVKTLPVEIFISGTGSVTANIRIHVERR